MIRAQHYTGCITSRPIQTSWITSHILFDHRSTTPNSLCAMQYLRSGTSNFQYLVQVLHNFIEKLYVTASKHTKRSISHISLDTIGGSEKHTDSFFACKAAVAHRTTLAHRDKTKPLCIYTDASDTHWSGILIQAAPDKLMSPHHEMEH